MNSLFNSNLKVHYAGAEQFIFAASLSVAKCKYALFTVFPCICEKVGLRAIVMGTKALRLSFDELPRQLASQNKHLIMDSGIYALAYGQMKGKIERGTMYKWYDSYVEFTNHYVPQGTSIVEVDCQSIISTQAAWDMRKKLREDCPNHEQINVWHFEDGKSGLDRIIEYASYIGFSVPEYKRMLGIRSYQGFVKKLVMYTKKKKPGIKIHLLGCTSKGILSELKNLVTSVDSTSWISAGKYGGRTDIEKAICQRQSGQMEYQECLKQLNRFYDVNMLSEGLKRDCARRALAAYYWKQEYTKWSGSQE